MNRQLSQNITPIIPTSVSSVDEDAQQRGVDEVLNGFDVAGHARDQVAGPRLVVVGEREPLNVVVERAPQIVRQPTG